MASENRTSFAQREGIAKIPEQLKPKQMSQQMRAMLWAAIYKDYQKSQKSGFERLYISGAWKDILLDLHVEVFHKMANSFSTDNYGHEKQLCDLYESGGYVEVLSFTEWVLRHPACSVQLRTDITTSLIKSRSAYRVIDGDNIMQITDEAEAASLTTAFQATANNEFSGSREHLVNAGKYLRDGKYPDSVRESIHAVESILKILEPGDKFAAALSKLESKLSIHGGLKAGFASLYGFTSEKDGIRHAKGNISDADVAEEDAIYMLGACASFVSYLIAKHRKSATK